METVSYYLRNSIALLSSVVPFLFTLESFVKLCVCKHLSSSVLAPTVTSLYQNPAGHTCPGSEGCSSDPSSSPALCWLPLDSTGVLKNSSTALHHRWNGCGLCGRRFRPKNSSCYSVLCRSSGGIDRTLDKKEKQAPKLVF